MYLFEKLPSVLLGIYPGVQLCSHTTNSTVHNSMLKYLRSCQTVPQSCCTFTSPLTIDAAAAAAAKSLLSCPTLCDPIDGSPPGSHVPGILQARWRGLKQLKIELPYDPAVPLRGTCPGENHNSRRRMHPRAHCSTIYNNQGVVATLMSVNR